VQVRVLDLVLVFSTATEQSRFRVQGHGDVHFRRRDQVHREVPAVQDAEDVHEEAVGTRALVTVHIKHNDVVLDGHGCRPLGALQSREDTGGAGAEKAGLLGGRAWLVLEAIGEDDGAVAARVHDVFDADGDARADDLLHGERMDDLGAVKRQFSSLGGRDRGEDTGRGDLARVCREDAVHLLPDLQFVCLDADGYQSSTQISIATSDSAQDASRDISEEARNDRNSVAASLYFFAQRFGEVPVKGLTHTPFPGRRALEYIRYVDVLGRRTAVVQQRSHVATAQLLALAHDLVLCAARHLFQVLRGLQNLDQSLAFDIDLLFELGEKRSIFQRVSGGLDVVGAEGLDDLVVGTRAGSLGGPGAAEEPVGGAFELGGAAARGADNGGAVRVQTAPTTRR
jgi:hypothetical protein